MAGEISIFDAAILGAIQGVTEFLPISSSGHLALANHLMKGLPDSRSSTSYFLILHLGTLLAVVWVFRKEILSYFGPNARAIPTLVVGTVPVVLLYLVAHSYLEAAQNHMSVIGALFLGTAVFLWLSERGWKEEKDYSQLTLLDAALVGMAQALALLPGLSRSGLTISTARMRQANRSGAATFSFLLSIIAILGAVVVKAPDLADLSATADVEAITVGFLTAFVTGLVSLTLLLRVIRSGRLAWFAPYCVALGVLAFVLGGI